VAGWMQLMNQLLIKRIFQRKFLILSLFKISKTLNPLAGEWFSFKYKLLAI
jgi:hypothetical protein